MGDIKGFKKYKRQTLPQQSVEERVEHFEEFHLEINEAKMQDQASRCMDCGIPFCHSGCPLGNYIPNFNHAVYQGNWKKAYHLLMSTNNFPEFTGRICPAPCESSCVLSINNDPVAIENIEKTIIERAFSEGWVKPRIPKHRSDKKIVIVGSGPAGLACADELNKQGHNITVIEKNDRIGGLLRYGIPDFKLDKSTVDRRVDLMKESGILFITNSTVGEDISVDVLQQNFDAIVLCGGATIARDLPIDGRNLKGVHLAMDYLEQNNRIVAGDTIDEKEKFQIKNKNIVVLGGGDTGSDCIGTSNRLGAASVTQIELLSKPPLSRKRENPWPNWPQILRTSSSQEEGCEREWSILTKRFVSEDGINLSGIEIVKVDWQKHESGKYNMTEVPNSTEVIPCDVAFLAIGFLHGKKEGLLSQLGVDIDQNGNVKTKNYATSKRNVFAAGDMRRGQSLVVWAIAEGRECAKEIDAHLTNAKTRKKVVTHNAYAL